MFQSKKPYQVLLMIITILMSALYAGIGIFFIVSPSNSFFPPTVSVILGILLVAYGIFRAFREYQKSRE